MKTRELADLILAEYEDSNEYHFHETERKWIIDAMEEFAKKMKCMFYLGNQ
jgi:hypothetical protein